MATYKPTSLLGPLTGSAGGITFTQNRAGHIIRSRTTPTHSRSTFATTARTRLATILSTWASYTEDRRVAWNTWAQANPQIGQTSPGRPLTGLQAYTALSAKLLTAGIAISPNPPTTPAPAPLTSLTVVADVGAGLAQITWTVTPLTSGTRIWIACALTARATNTSTKGHFVFLTTTAAAASSPFSIKAALLARFGTIPRNMLLTVLCSTFTQTTGRTSPPLRASVVVTST